MGWALDQPDIPGRPKLVLVAIANHADHTDGYCWLKAETIAREASCTPRSVFRFIGALVRNGYLRRAPRRGADGKQRANDYWILFNREDRTWDWKAGLEGQESDGLDDENEPLDDVESNAETHTSETVDPLAVVDAEPTEKHVLSHGPHDSPVLRQDEKTPVLSHGPCDTGVSHKRIAEPSKTNPENVGLGKSQPRTYRPPPPPPPQPIGATTLQGTGSLFFVFKPSRGYDAWKREKERETGRPFNAETWREGRLGWYFPTLFPPEKPPPSGSENASDTEIDPPYESRKTG